MFFSGFRIQGYSENCGLPSVTAVGNQYTVVLSSQLVAGISDSIFQILFYNVGIIQRSNRFSFTYHSFMGTSSSINYVPSASASSSISTLIYGLRYVTAQHNTFLNM
jgi:hypothetical protein